MCSKILEFFIERSCIITSAISCPKTYRPGVSGILIVKIFQGTFVKRKNIHNSPKNLPLQTLMKITFSCKFCESVWCLFNVYLIEPLNTWWDVTYHMIWNHLRQYYVIVIVYFPCYHDDWIFHWSAIKSISYHIYIYIYHCILKENDYICISYVFHIIKFTFMAKVLGTI